MHHHRYKTAVSSSETWAMWEAQVRAQPEGVVVVELLKTDSASADFQSVHAQKAHHQIRNPNLATVRLVEEEEAASLSAVSSAL